VVDVFLVANSNNKQRLVVDCRRANCWFQKSGSVESRSISAMRLFLRSTSKRPPKPVQAGLEIVHLFNELIIRHGRRFVMRAMRLTQASFRC
jgi:hypothetical protein